MQSTERLWSNEQHREPGCFIQTKDTQLKTHYLHMHHSVRGREQSVCICLLKKSHKIRSSSYQSKKRKLNKPFNVTGDHKKKARLHIPPRTWDTVIAGASSTGLENWVNLNSWLSPNEERCHHLLLWGCCFFWPTLWHILSVWGSTRSRYKQKKIVITFYDNKRLVPHGVTTAAHVIWSLIWTKVCFFNAYTFQGHLAGWIQHCTLLFGPQAQYLTPFLEIITALCHDNFTHSCKNTFYQQSEIWLKIKTHHKLTPKTFDTFWPLPK